MSSVVMLDKVRSTLENLRMRHTIEILEGDLRGGRAERSTGTGGA